MKIAVFIDQFSPGATPKWVGVQVKHFRELGHEAEVVSIMEGGLPEGSYQFQTFLDGVPIRYLSREFPLIKIFNFKLPMFAFFSAYHLASAFLISRMIKNKEYDVVIAHASLTCFIAQRLWKSRKIPYVALMWDPISYIITRVYSRWLPKKVTKYLARLALHFDKVIADNSLVTVTAAEPQIKLIKTFASKDVEFLYPGCFPIEQLPEKRGDYLLAIDRWDVGMPPHILLDVMERLSRKVELRVAGFWWPDKFRQSFIKLRDEKGLTDQVKVLGPVSEEELNELYLNARALVYPRDMYVCIPALEAAGYGCPMVMPKGTALFTHGVNSLFPAEGDIDQYAEYVDRLVNDERLAWTMGYEAWKIARENTWEHHANKLEEIVMKYI